MANGPLGLVMVATCIGKLHTSRLGVGTSYGFRRKAGERFTSPIWARLPLDSTKRKYTLEFQGVTGAVHRIHHTVSTKGAIQLQSKDHENFTNQDPNIVNHAGFTTISSVRVTFSTGRSETKQHAHRLADTREKRTVRRQRTPQGIGHIHAADRKKDKSDAPEHPLPGHFPRHPRATGQAAGGHPPWPGAAGWAFCIR